jgi:hypothetical protein
MFNILLQSAGSCYTEGSCAKHYGAQLDDEMFVWFNEQSHTGGVVAMGFPAWSV